MFMFITTTSSLRVMALQWHLLRKSISSGFYY